MFGPTYKAVFEDGSDEPRCPRHVDCSRGWFVSKKSRAATAPSVMISIRGKGSFFPPQNRTTEIIARLGFGLQFGIVLPTASGADKAELVVNRWVWGSDYSSFRAPDYWDAGDWSVIAGHKRYWGLLRGI